MSFLSLHLNRVCNGLIYELGLGGKGFLLLINEGSKLPGKVPKMVNVAWGEQSSAQTSKNTQEET